jgi:acetyl-CoA acetyltransferase
MKPVYCLGAFRTDFKRNLMKEGKTLRDVIVEAARGAVSDARIDFADVQSGVVGNFAAGLYTRQLHLGSLLLDADPELVGIPTLHTEAACASGSVAVTTAIQQIAGGIHDCVLVVGAEQQKTMSPAQGADVLAAAGDWNVEKPQYGEHMFPKLFARIATIYREKHALSDEQLAKVAVKNFAHAKRNPNAQMRDFNMTLDYACNASEKNPCFAPPLKVTDCSQVTDGAAGIVLCSQEFLQKRGKMKAIKLLGFGQTTDYLTLEKKQVPEFPAVRLAAKKAFAMASMGIKDISSVEVHDCFSITELVAYEALGLAENGGAGKFLETGATALPQARESAGLGKSPAISIPVNTGGGLMADGHPVGATGVRQVVEAFQQLTQQAGDRQVEGAKTVLTFNMGGSLTTCVAMIWGKN